MLRLSLSLLLCTSGIACQEKVEPLPANDPAPLDSVNGSPMTGDLKRPLPTASVVPAVADDPTLRRVYGPKDMKIHPCAKLQADGTIVGHQCPSAFVVFGPYVAAPANSKLSVSFVLESEGQVEVTSDVVSDVGKRFHGALDEQTLGANERRRIGYRIQLFEATTAVEARVGIRALTPVNFKLSNLNVAVQ